MANPQLQSIFPSLDGSQLAAIIVDPYLESKEDARVHEGDAKSTWRQMCDLQDFREPQVWMAGLVELWVTGLNVFASGAAGIALGSQKNVISPFLLPMIGGIIGALTLPLFIFAALPASGGHINPLITLGAFAIQALSLPRTIVYIVGQTVGATVGAALLRVALGDKAVASAFIPGCTWSPSKSISLLQAFTLESVACAILLWVSFAAGLDPRQGGVFGRVLGPMVIGLTLGVTIFITGIAKPGYSGASMNPARCFGLLAATGNLENHFIHWAGPLAAALASGLAYLAMPPYKSEMTVPEIKGDAVLPRV